MAETAKSSVADDGRICDVAGKREATIDDLYHVEGKAELVNGELVLMAAAGKRHGRVALKNRGEPAGVREADGTWARDTR